LIFPRGFSFYFIYVVFNTKAIMAPIPLNDITEILSTFLYLTAEESSQECFFTAAVFFLHSSQCR